MVGSTKNLFLTGAKDILASVNKMLWGRGGSTALPNACFLRHSLLGVVRCTLANLQNQINCVYNYNDLPTKCSYNLYKFSRNPLQNPNENRKEKND